MKYLSALSFLLIFHSFMTAQAWQSIVDQHTNYFDAVEAADTYYASHSRGKGSGFKQYMRWKGEMQYHID
jgi:hypothetical protein